MIEPDRNKRYISYLLRIWQVGSRGDSKSSNTVLWRASLQDPLSSERLVFASLKELFLYLEDQTGMDSGARSDTEDE